MPKESMKDIIKRLKPKVDKETKLSRRGGIKTILKKDERKENTHFEGPHKNSGVDKRKNINQERRSI